jgi:metal-dependent amidase/aminoacylase/carboxypeptidase family protein
MLNDMLYDIFLANCAFDKGNDLPYVSQNEGVMHACGHDSHMAILLGAAKVLASMKEEIHGKIRSIFQPASVAGTGQRAPITLITPRDSTSMTMSSKTV